MKIHEVKFQIGRKDNDKGYLWLWLAARQYSYFCKGPLRYARDEMRNRGADHNQFSLWSRFRFRMKINKK